MALQGTVWVWWVAGWGWWWGWAPTDASYIVQTWNGTLTNEQALDVLATWLLKNTTWTWVLSIATDWTDYIWTTSIKKYTNSLSTGILTWWALSINWDPTKFDVSAWTWIIIDNTTDPANPTITTVSWGTSTAIITTNLATSPATIVYIDSWWNIQQWALGTITDSDRRSKIILGSLIHPNLTNITGTANEPYPVIDPVCSLHDLALSIGLLNLTGNVFSANWANLNINKSSWTIFWVWRNYINAKNNPNILSVNFWTAQTFTIAYRNWLWWNTTVPSQTSIVPWNYDDWDWTLGTVWNNQRTIQRIYMNPKSDWTYDTFIVYWQFLYNSKSEAIASIGSEWFVKLAWISGNLLRAYLIVKWNATTLNDTAQAIFIDVGKFQSTVWWTWASWTVRLQDAYDNSTTPEILTDATRGAFTIKRGSAADTDYIFELQDWAWNITFTINWNWQVVWQQYNWVTITATTWTITIQNAKTFSCYNTLTLTWTDWSSVAFWTWWTVAYSWTAQSFTTLTATNTASLTLWTSSSVAWQIIFKNGTNTNTLTIQSWITWATITYTLPATAPTDWQYLSSLADWTMSWWTPWWLAWGASISSWTWTWLTMTTADLAWDKAFLSLAHTASWTLTANTTTQSTLSTSRTHTNASTVIDNFIWQLFSRTNVMNQAWGMLLSQWSVVSITWSDTQTAGTLTPSYNLLLLTPSLRSTGSSISITQSWSNAVAPTNGHLYILLWNTQNAAHTMQKIDLGTSARLHTWLSITYWGTANVTLMDLRLTGSNDAWSCFFVDFKRWVAMQMQTTDILNNLTAFNLVKSASWTAPSRTNDFCTITFNNTHTWATTITDNFDHCYFSRTSVVNNAWATYNASWTVLKLENVATQTAWTLTDTVNVLEVVQDIDSTWRIASFKTWTTEYVWVSVKGNLLVNNPTENWNLVWWLVMKSWTAASANVTDWVQLWVEDRAWAGTACLMLRSEDWFVHALCPLYWEAYITSATTTTINTVDVWEEVNATTFASWELQGITQSWWDLTVTTAWKYEVLCALSATVTTANKIFEFAFSVQDSIQTKTIIRRFFSSTDTWSICIAWILSLSANDVVKVEVRNTTDDTDITINNMDFQLHAI